MRALRMNPDPHASEGACLEQKVVSPRWATVKYNPYDEGYIRMGVRMKRVFCSPAFPVAHIFKDPVLRADIALPSVGANLVFGDNELLGSVG